MEKIKPCPFCGSEDIRYIPLAGCVFCEDCRTYGPCESTDKDAIRKWNAAWRKEDAEMEKSCQNCKYLKLGYQNKNKWYCTKALETVADEHSCKSWAPYNPFGDTHATACDNCQYGYRNDDKYYCGKAIGNLDYCCTDWEAKEPEPAPLTPSNSSGLKTLCEEAISKWGEEAQISKAIEELSELVTALARWQNFCTNAKGPEILDNIREEREDVEIMLRQLDVIFGRSEEWQRKKYAHLQLIVGDTGNE